ncbi:LysR family transcriptional regulator [Photobacterium sp. WH77]|uniref:LysR family transcriptional regulator n=1 Tax=unclassified Photobacterium TaxID=2628852 RepID=UPI001C44C431|nr:MULTISPECIES: LysR family transcriptional regulator [unclassified Photobacterium]MBV7262303.1 LysR family transcriptional regulator [Photobacterium sp. WH24]MCG2839193.1 LysR family transcriptional regulator [Photobacterium sp. WH77]MCG2846810.1 LysR family transcriptional regulator [Photobacterium sp. WH80]
MAHQLDTLDLNLMRLLKAVVDHKSIKVAAAQLGISQPSASRGVARLKTTFNDPLFVRKPHGVEPSPMALRLAEEFDNILAPIAKVLHEFEDFSALAYDGQLSLVIDPYLLDEQGARLLSGCYQAFPRATFSFSSWNNNSQGEMLEGMHDYCILDQETELSNDIYMRPLFTEKRMILARHNHPSLSLDKDSNDWEAVAQLPIVSLPSPASYNPLCTVESEYQRMGYQPNVLLKTYSLRVAAEMLLNTDAIMYASKSSIRLFPDLVAYPMPAVNREFSDFVISGGFLQTNRNHPMHQHLHRIVKNLFKHPL